MEEENKFKEDKLKKNAEGVNYYSGDKIEDLVPDAVPNEVKGDTQDDSNYIDEMYSDKQLERHKDMDNIFKVDGVPSRWEHNKSRSTWHFDPLKDPYSDEDFCKDRVVDMMREFHKIKDTSLWEITDYLCEQKTTQELARKWD